MVTPIRDVDLNHGGLSNEFIIPCWDQEEEVAYGNNSIIRRISLDSCDDNIIGNQYTCKKRRPRVRFSEENEVISNPIKSLSEDDIDAQWWSKEELYGIKKSAKSLCALLRNQVTKVHSGGRTSGAACRSLSMAHKKTTLMVNSEVAKLIELPLSSPDQDLLRWCAHRDGRRGLERFASQDYSLWYRTDVIKMRKAVFQRQMERNGQCCVIGDISREETIAESSRAVTRRARTFALFMGEADALEARRIATSKNRTKRHFTTIPTAVPLNYIPPLKRRRSGASKQYESTF